MSRFKVLIMFLIVLSMAVPFSLMLAQESTEEPTPTLEASPTAEITVVPTLTPTETPPPVDPPEELPPTPPADVLSRLLALLDNATYIAWAVAGGVIITGAIKTLFYFANVRIEGVAAALLALAVQVIIWILYSAANAVGMGETFRTQYELIVELIRSLLPLVGSIFGGHVLYQAAASRRVPLLGFYPPPKLGKYDVSPGVKTTGEGRDWRNQP